MMPDPIDQPEEETYGLVYPFVVCASNGGRYDDDAFVAGVQVGRVDAELRMAEAIGALEMRFTIRSTLRRQAELIGMARGFPDIEIELTSVQGWIDVTYRREAAQS